MHQLPNAYAWRAVWPGGWLGGVATVLLLVAAVLGALQTGWAKGYLRGLIVRQANQYLTATLEIGSLGGSLVRGIELGDVRLSREGEPIIAIDRVTVSYCIRELVDRGVTIARIQRRPAASRRCAATGWTLEPRRAGQTRRQAGGAAWSSPPHSHQVDRGRRRRRRPSRSAECRVRGRPAPLRNAQRVAGLRLRAGRVAARLRPGLLEWR